MRSPSFIIQLHLSEATLAKRKNAISARELDVMQALWSLGTATVAEVHEAMRREGDSLAVTTLQTMLARLEQKGAVARKSVGKAHQYRPLLSRPAAVAEAIRRLARSFFNGSEEALAAHLIEKDLPPKQLDRLQKMIDTKRSRR